MQAVVKQFHKKTPIEIRRLVVAALCVHQLRLTDISMRDKVAIVYHSCGDEVRAHTGRMYCFACETGHLKPYSGLVSDTILQDIQDFLLTLEGLFRCMGGAGHVARNHVAVLKECHRLLTHQFKRCGRDWSKVAQSLKKASLHNEGDEEAKVDALLSGYRRRIVVKQTLPSPSQAS